MIKNIFGKIYKFTQSESVLPLLSESLELYPDAGETESVDVLVSVLNKKALSGEILSRNPSIHASTTQGMYTKLGLYGVSWTFDENRVLIIGLNYDFSFLGAKGLYKKIRHMECPTEVENFEQVLHELVLVPSLYFFDDRMPLHASSVNINGKTVLFSGTGGVGKSSAMLAVRNIKSATFISDDIAAIDDNGLIYGNMAWPKVYGYNCIGTNIDQLILKGRGVLDKLQFNWKKANNPSSVRRKIKPNKLYENVSSISSKANSIFYLFRESVDQILVSALDSSQAIDMAIKVMESEYSIFHNHLHWQEYNALATKTLPILTMEDVKSRWRVLLESGFCGVKLYKISVPLEVKHEEYLKFVNELLGSL